MKVTDLKRIFGVIVFLLHLFVSTLSAEEIRLGEEGGVHTLPVILNGTVKLDFILDSGASKVCITPDILLVLIKSGTVRPEHFLGEQKFSLADGSEVKSTIVLLEEVQVGDTTVLNVEAAVSNEISGGLLLGQSFLRKLSAWSISNHSGILSISGAEGAAVTVSPVTANPHASYAIVPQLFYRAVEVKDYLTAWSLLTEASKVRIVSMVADEAKMSVAEVRALFDGNAQEIQDGFWASFREGDQVKLILSLNLQYSGQKDGFHVISATMPEEKGGNGQTMDILVKDENGPKFGIAETFQF